MKFFFLASPLLLCFWETDAFQIAPQQQLGKLLTSPSYYHHTTSSSSSSSSLASKNKASDDVVMQQAYIVGTFVEFEEKGREHIGKVVNADHKSSGGARYQVVDCDGSKYDIPDKAIAFAMNAPNSPAAADKLFGEFLAAHDASEKTIQSKLDMNSELLEMAWEESSETEDHLLTPAALVDLIHSHAASAIEKYMAWKFLRTETSHIFFKEIKDHGRVVGFKAKARKAVEAAKQTFCNSHADSDLCLV